MSAGFPGARRTATRSKNAATGCGAPMPSARTRSGCSARSLAERLKAEGIPAVEIEYERAYKVIESDPGAAVTAACAILESVTRLLAERHARHLD